MSQQTLPAPGTYNGAKKNGKIVIGDPEKAGGYLIANIPTIIPNINPPFQFVAAVFLANKEGAPYVNAIKNLKNIFKWDGMDFFSLEEIESNDFTYDLIDCVHKSRVKKIRDEDGFETEVEVTEFCPTFINAPGAGRFEPMDESQKKSIRAEYASKLKALFGGKAPSKPAAAPAKEPDEIPGLEAQKPATATETPAKRSPGRPPSKKPATTPPRKSDSDEVWKLLTAKMGGETDEASHKYISAWEAVDPNRQDLDAEGWGKVADALGL